MKKRRKKPKKIQKLQKFPEKTKVDWPTKYFAETRHRSPNFLEKLLISHLNLINFIVHVLAAIVLISGFWNHNWTAIILGIILILLGHAYTLSKEWQ